MSPIFNQGPYPPRLQAILDEIGEFDYGPEKKSSVLCGKLMVIVNGTMEEVREAADFIRRSCNWESTLLHLKRVDIPEENIDWCKERLQTILSGTAKEAERAQFEIRSWCRETFPRKFYPRPCLS